MVVQTEMHDIQRAMKAQSKHTMADRKCVLHHQHETQQQ